MKEQKGIMLMNNGWTKWALLMACGLVAYGTGCGSDDSSAPGGAAGSGASAGTGGSGATGGTGGSSDGGTGGGTGGSSDGGTGGSSDGGTGGGTGGTSDGGTGGTSDGGTGGGTGGSGGAAAFDLHFSGTGYGPHEGQRLYAAVVDSASAVVARDDRQVSGGAFAMDFTGALMEGQTYSVDWYADFNGNGACDAPPTDHAWTEAIPAVTGDVTLEVTHNTNFTNVCSWMNP